MSIPWIPDDKDAESARKGYAFEQFVVSQFIDSHFDFLHWRSDKSIGGIRAADNGDPDLLYRYVSWKSFDFAVECKYRSKDEPGLILWGLEPDLQRYRKFEEKSKAKVFLVIGIGGRAEEPGKVFIIPLTDVRKSHLCYADLLAFPRLTHPLGFQFDQETGLIY
jgi:hypothetical protein